MADEKDSNGANPEGLRPETKEKWERHKEFVRDMRRLKREEQRKAFPLLGSSIATKPEHAEALETQLGLITAATQMMLTGAQLKDKYNKGLWDLLHQHYPETEGYALSLDHKTRYISLIGIEDE